IFCASRCSSSASARSSRRAASSTPPSPVSAVMVAPHASPPPSIECVARLKEAAWAAPEAAVCLTRLGAACEAVSPASFPGETLSVPPLTMANAIRALSMDAVHRAKSGHQGMPLGMADVATVLWTRILKFDAADPDWADRDRFVLSAGHGSMLLYSLLHLTGFPGMSM